MAPLLLIAIAILETAAGALSAIGCVLLHLPARRPIAFYGALVSAIAILAPVFRSTNGQRVSGGRSLSFLISCSRWSRFICSALKVICLGLPAAVCEHRNFAGKQGAASRRLYREASRQCFRARDVAYDSRFFDRRRRYSGVLARRQAYTARTGIERTYAS